MVWIKAVMSGYGYTWLRVNPRNLPYVCAYTFMYVLPVTICNLFNSTTEKPKKNKKIKGLQNGYR